MTSVTGTAYQIRLKGKICLIKQFILSQDASIHRFSVYILIIEQFLLDKLLPGFTVKIWMTQSFLWDIFSFLSEETWIISSIHAVREYSGDTSVLRGFPHFSCWADLDRRSTGGVTCRRTWPGALAPRSPIQRTRNPQRRWHADLIFGSAAK